MGFWQELFNADERGFVRINADKAKNVLESAGHVFG
jgi:hypothetical protein